MIWLFLVFANFSAFAYIPEYPMIISRTADQHGKGAYVIEQEVTFRREAEAYVIKETWVVNGESNLRVSLEGRGVLKGLVQGSILYDTSTKHFLESAGASVRSNRLGEDWLEPLFTFRSSKYLRNRLVNLKVTPPESLQDRPPLPTEGEIKYQPPNFVRLGRVGGAIAWAIGNSPTSATAPTLWIEQDQFLVRKFRGTNQTLLRANDYAKYEEGLWFPRQRTYNFGNWSVEVQTLRVKALGRLKADDKTFKSSGLTNGKDNLKLPDADGLKKFYARFR